MKMRNAKCETRNDGCARSTPAHGTRNTEHGARNTHHASRITHHSPRLAFTLIEIAISLAVIGFALVAIIGILPFGMNAQKENRQETIITQDAKIFMDAIRNGAMGSDDLTNYVLAITNYQLHYSARGNARSIYGYTYTNSTINNALSTPQMPITNGTRIVGLLSTPKLFVVPGTLGFFSNHVVAYVRSISGPASEKFPQTNSTIQDFALTYRLICDVGPYFTNYYSTNWINTAGLSTNDPNLLARFNYSNVINNLEANLHDLRLTFRWPILPNGDVGPERQIFRTLVGGQLIRTNDHGYPIGLTNLFFFDPHTYAKAQ